MWTSVQRKTVWDQINSMYVTIKQVSIKDSFLAVIKANSYQRLSKSI